MRRRIGGEKTSAPDESSAPGLVVMRRIILEIATLLGGIAAVWFLWDRFPNKRKWFARIGLIVGLVILALVLGMALLKESKPGGVQTITRDGRTITITANDRSELEKGNAIEPEKQKEILGNLTLEEWRRLIRIGRYNDVPGYGIVTNEEFNNLPVDAKKQYWQKREEDENRRRNAGTSSLTEWEKERKREWAIVGNFTYEEEIRFRAMTPEQRKEYLKRKQ